MKFLGYDFPTIAMPFNLSYSPPGWQDQLTFQVSRRGATPPNPLIAASPASRIRPLMFEPLPIGNLPRLTCASVVDALLANPGAAGPGANATDLPTIWSQRPQVLDQHGMDNVMCAGFMIATFSYEDSVGGKSVHRHQDSVVGTAINLAKRKVGQLKVTMLHDNSTKPADNNDQAHTEMCLAMQLDAFLTFLETNAETGKRAKSAHEFVKDFKMDKLVIEADIRWDHRQNNVTIACGACQGTMDAVETKWADKVKSISLTPSKAA